MHSNSFLPTDRLKSADGQEVKLENSTKINIGGRPLSALATARNIDDIRTVQYPEGVMSPKPELNANVKDGRFRYDRDFLLQFMGVCTQKPDMLPPLETIGLEPLDQGSLGTTRGASRRYRQGSGAAAPPRQASVGLGFGPLSGLGKSQYSNPFSMGRFTTSGSKLSSDERFANSTSRSVSMNAATGLPFNRPVPMQRKAGQGGAGSPLRDRTRCEHGGDRNKMEKDQQGHGSGFDNFQAVN